MRHLAVGDRVDHLRAGLDDAALLVLGAHHVAGGVLQEEQRGIGLVGQLDELRGLLRLLAEEHAAGVRQDSDRVAVDARPARDERAAIQRLVLVEAAAVDDPGEDLTRVDRDAEVGGSEIEQLVLVVDRRVGGTARTATALAVIEVSDDLPAEPKRIELIDGEIVRASGQARVHAGAAERLVVGVLTGRHLHQRRPGEEDLRPTVDHDRVVAHPGDVRAARGGVAEHQRDGRDARCRQVREVAKSLPARDEDLGLGRQIRTTGFDQIHVGQTVFARDVRGAADLAQGVGVGRAAAYGRIVRVDHDLDALDHTDAGDRTARPPETPCPTR